MRILVTGGVGFIGSHLVKKLIDLKHQVLIVDKLNTIGGIPFVHPKSFFIKGDICNKKILKKIEKWRPSIIYHLAAQSGGESAYDNPKNDYLTNGYGTYVLTNLAKKLRIKHFIYSSSVAVYGSNLNRKINENTEITPDSIYGISKYAGEMFLKLFNKETKIKTTVFRIFNTFGPGENLNFEKKGMVKIYSSYIWRKKPIIVKGSLNRFRNYQFIDDVINILVKSLSNKKLKNFEVINLSSSKMTLVKNLIKLILKINGIKSYKVIKKNSTKGDSFGYNSSNRLLKKKFPNYKFLSLQQGLIKYFNWIHKVPNKKSLKNFHPFKLK